MRRPSHANIRHDSRATEPTRTSSARSATLGILTININSWFPFRDKWSAEGEPSEFSAVQVMMIQEHHLTTQELCDDAQEWLEGRGWRAVFGLAAMLPSGRPSGGVARLFRQSDTLGITDPALSAGDLGHRLLAVRMVVDGYEPFIVAVAYFEVGAGLNKLNHTPSSAPSRSGRRPYSSQRSSGRTSTSRRKSWSNPRTSSGAASAQ